MMKKLFTERHGEGKPRVAETLDDATREGLLTLVSARIDEEWFGLSFNQKCGDGYAYAGTDLTRLGRTMNGYGIIWPHDVDRSNPPTDGQVFDLLEFSYEFITEARGHGPYLEDPWHRLTCCNSIECVLRQRRDIVRDDDAPLVGGPLDN